MNPKIIFTVTTGKHRRLKMPVEIVLWHGEHVLLTRGRPFNSDVPEVWMDFHPDDFSDFPVELKAKLSMMRLKGELK